MGRYVSQHSQYRLPTRGAGLSPYKFENGVLVVGDPTTFTGTGNYIDAAYDENDIDNSLQWIMPHDLLGYQSIAVELAGQGSLLSVDDNDAALGRLDYGYVGVFFKAPVLTGTSDAVEAIAGIPYEVLSGTVGYKGVSYAAGKRFVTDGSITATTGSGTFAAAVPKRLTGEVEQFLEEDFKLKHLTEGDEAAAYGDMGLSGGYTPVSYDFVRSST